MPLRRVACAPGRRWRDGWVAGSGYPSVRCDAGGLKKGRSRLTLSARSVMRARGCRSRFLGNAGTAVCGEPVLRAEARAPCERAGRRAGAAPLLLGAFIFSLQRFAAPIIPGRRPWIIPSASSTIVSISSLQLTTESISPCKQPSVSSQTKAEPVDARGLGAHEGQPAGPHRRFRVPALLEGLLVVGPLHVLAEGVEIARVLGLDLCDLERSFCSTALSV